MLAPGLHFPKGWPSSPCPPPAPPCPPSGDTDFHLPMFSAPTRLPFVFLLPPYFPPSTLLSCSTARPLSAEAVASRMRTPSSSAGARGLHGSASIHPYVRLTCRVGRCGTGGKTAEKDRKPPWPLSFVGKGDSC